ncbi:hypothetical protein VCRA2123O443_80129 [Vibrio crassostreae]|nr:hypothetical protein VCRA2110O182_60129 [Vibrio crassostreae]CAK2356255.1 hypothetical protein VCRA2111O408_60068 [Vibrio crassostreae]CAK2371037.1 hypothetical protein VCRA211O406_60071 [Vibrio crassostreae]CAK3507896.1 hypothetical protein VCRA2123O443_80129 [Vibrio crassostreae]
MKHLEILWDAKLLIFGCYRYKKRRPGTSLNVELVELAGVEPASKNHSSLVLHA